jgi:hypothetical protein
MMRFSIVIAFLLTIGSKGLFGQCDYDYRKTDPLTGDLEFRTKLERITGVTKNKGVANFAYCKAAFSRSSLGEELILEIRYTNTYKQTMMFRTDVDSLSIKFDDGSICSVKLTVAPSPLVLSSQVRTTVTWKLNYTLTDQLKELFRAGRKVVFMRIRTSKFNTDIDEFDMDLTATFRECWEEGTK